MTNIIEKTIEGSNTRYMDTKTPISALKFWELDQLTSTYGNFSKIGYLQAGECAELFLYTCDYGSFYFFSEQAGTQPKHSEMRDCDYRQAMEVLIDWADKENTHWDASQGKVA